MPIHFFVRDSMFEKRLSSSIKSVGICVPHMDKAFQHAHATTALQLREQGVLNLVLILELLLLHHVLV